MKGCTTNVTIGILAVVCFGLVLSVAYPLTVSDSHATVPPSERFSVNDTDAYSATGSLVVDGQVRLAFDGVVSADWSWYQKIVDEGVVSESYHSAGSGAVYQRLNIEAGENDDQRRTLIRGDEDRTLVRLVRDGDRVTVIVKENTTSATEPVSGTASVFLDSL